MALSGWRMQQYIDYHKNNIPSAARAPQQRRPAWRLATLSRTIFALLSSGKHVYWLYSAKMRISGAHIPRGGVFWRMHAKTNSTQRERDEHHAPPDRAHHC
jgi:hypothetical protein